jgi:hypothetical protein
MLSERPEVGDDVPRYLGSTARISRRFMLRGSQRSPGFADRVGVKYGGTDLRTVDASGESVVVTIASTNVYALPAQ